MSTKCPGASASTAVLEPAAGALQKRARGGQPGNSNRLVHGAYRKRRLLNSVDWSTQADRRSKLYRELRERTERIVEGAGGPDAIGPNRLALAPYAAQVALEIDTLNAAIRDRGPIDRRRNTARKLVEDRNRLLRTLRELLNVIGLDREPSPGPTLDDVVARYRERSRLTQDARSRRGDGAD